MQNLSEERSHPNHWYNRAADLRATAGAAWYAIRGDQEHGIAASLGFSPGYSMDVACRPVYHMLSGLALEVIIKAVMKQRGSKIPEHHDLNNLASQIGFARTPHERRLLKFYTSSVIWAGRYPTPRNCSDEQLVRFFDEAGEVLTKPGKNLGTLRLRVASGATDWEHFHALWLRIASEFEFS